MTNRDKVLLELSKEENITLLAKTLIKTEVENSGDYRFDGEDEYWVDNYTTTYISPSGEVYFESYDNCLEDAIEWLTGDVK